MTAAVQSTVGDVLRDWRRRRRRSQLELAGDAAVSTRHLSFVESGRASGSRAMLLRLADELAMPLRERNRLLLAGGYAPLHPERPLAHPDLAAARNAVETVLAAHEPFPALAVDRHWTLVAANRAVAKLIASAEPALLAPPVNVLRLSLHPAGLASRIVNLGEWRHHVLDRLRRQADAAGDPVLTELHSELSALPFRASRSAPQSGNEVAVLLKLRETGSDAPLSFLSTTTVFGTATDLTLSELALECFYPADEETRAHLLARASDGLP